MRIVAISDTHGYLPTNLPKGDVLVHAGDVCPDFPGKAEKYDLVDKGGYEQANWLDTTFRAWLNHVGPEFKHVVAIAGNHDFVFEKSQLVPDLPWIYLKDSSVEIDGVKFFGTPWVPGLKRWAFYADYDTLTSKRNGIPPDTDVLISHGPPFGYGDKCGPGAFSAGERVGEDQLVDAIKRIKPLATICGHIHGDHGLHTMRVKDLPLPIYNASMVDEAYAPVFEPTVIDL